MSMLGAISRVAARVWRVASKIIGNDQQHLSRFHSLDGTRATIALLPSFARASLCRLTRQTGGRPWMSDHAVAALAAVLRPGFRVLELGSGESSLWLSARVCSVLSYETNRKWFAKLQAATEAAGLQNLTLRFCEGSTLLSSLESLPAGQFDLVIVDHSDSTAISRSDTLRAVRRLVSSNGYLLLDDSDRPAYADALGSYNAWSRLDIYGFVARPLRLTRTTLVQRTSP